MVTEQMVYDRIVAISKEMPVVFTERLASELNTTKEVICHHYSSLRDKYLIKILSTDGEVVELLR